MTKRIVLVSAGVLLFVAVLAALVRNVERAPTPAPAGKPEPAKPPVDASRLARFHSPSFGDPNARVHIVEFLDPACATCRDFYPLVKEMIAANPGRIRLSIRYAPFHKGSDQVVRLLEAARRQGKYWPALEALLAAQAQWTINHVAHIDLALRAVERVGLDMTKLKHDMAAPELGTLIRQDVEDGAALNVDKTPEFFVNGRPLPRFGYEELRTLVSQALREAYP